MSKCLSDNQCPSLRRLRAGDCYPSAASRQPVLACGAFPYALHSWRPWPEVRFRNAVARPEAPRDPIGGREGQRLELRRRGELAGCPGWKGEPHRITRPLATRKEQSPDSPELVVKSMKPLRIAGSPDYPQGLARTIFSRRQGGLEQFPSSPIETRHRLSVFSRRRIGNGSISRAAGLEAS
jgi:hypothetical protein